MSASTKDVIQMDEKKLESLLLPEAGLTHDAGRHWESNAQGHANQQRSKRMNHLTLSSLQVKIHTCKFEHNILADKLLAPSDSSLQR